MRRCRPITRLLTSLGKQGDFKDNVLRVNVPRNGLHVVIDGVATPTPFGFGGWLGLTVTAIVPPNRRTYASGVTKLTRTVGWAVGPPIAGAIMQSISLAAPIFIDGTMKIAYDIVLCRSFRRVRPPEEERPTCPGPYRS
jgi:hypothetical protein